MGGLCVVPETRHSPFTPQPDLSVEPQRLEAASAPATPSSTRAPSRPHGVRPSHVQDAPDRSSQYDPAAERSVAWSEPTRPPAKSRQNGYDRRANPGCALLRRPTAHSCETPPPGP